MKKYNLETIFIFIIFIASVFTIVFMGLTGNTQQVYNDIVIEWTAYTASNKSIERIGMYLVIFLGITVYLVFMFKNKIDNTDMFNEDFNSGLSFPLLFIMVLSILISHTIVIPLLCLLPCLMWYLYKKKEAVNDAIVTYFILLYSLIGCSRIFIACGFNFQCNIKIISILTAVIICLLLYLNDLELKLKKIALFAQLFIPFLCLIFLSDRYIFNNQIIVIKVYSSVIIFAWSVIVLALFDELRGIYKYWNKEIDFNKLISYGTCVCIMIFNRYSGTGAIMSNDLHHPFENIISYSQMYKLGQSAFEEYIPISGLHSLVQGAVFEVFGKGEFANYYSSENVFYSIIVIVTLYLLDLQLSRKNVFLLCLTFGIIDYNRVAFIMPIMLLLILPKLLENKNLWLLTWLLSSLFHGLYYPLYGTATFVAFAPLACIQIKEIITNNEIVLFRKSVILTLGWTLSVSLCLISIPWLWGLAKHMIAMSGQSILADGITRFGQLPPKWFFSYITNQYLRVVLYDIFTYILPALIVWCAFILALNIGDVKFDSKKQFFVAKKKDFLTLISLVILPLIVYSFTFIRIDVDSILARSSGVLISLAVVLFVISKRYRLSYNLQKIVFIAVFSVPVFTGIGVNSLYDWKLSNSLIVPDGYILVNNLNIRNLGRGFMNKDIYHYISNKCNDIYDSKDCYYNIGLFGIYYFSNVPGVSVMESYTTKGFGAVTETVNILKNKKCIVGYINSFENYYLYKWILTSGKYYWNKTIGCFSYVEDNTNNEKVLMYNKQAELGTVERDYGKVLSELGNSEQDLSKIFSLCNFAYNLKFENDNCIVEFSEKQNGNSVDFVYVEFDINKIETKYYLYSLYNEVEYNDVGLYRYFMKKNYNPGQKIRYEWFDDNGRSYWSICDIRQGKILFPLGSGKNWLLNNHKKIIFSKFNDGKFAKMPKIKNIKFLKLREVQ